MPSCVHCSKPLVCECKQPQPMGQTTMGCPAKKGALWIHVTDDLGVNLKGVGAFKNDEVSQPTSGKGLLVFDELNAADYTAGVRELGSFAGTHDPPVPESKPVVVKNGMIAYVPFLLQRKAVLKVQTVLQSDAKTIVSDCLIKVTAKGPVTKAEETKAGVVDFGRVSAGEYKLSAAFADLKQDRFDVVEPETTITLDPGEETTVAVIQLRPKTKLRVQVVLRSDNKVVVKDCPVKVTRSDPGGTTEETQDGVADFGVVTAGKYKISAVFTDPEQNRFDFVASAEKDVELKPGEDGLVLVEVEPLYRKVVFIAHVLLTIAKQIWSPQKQEWQAKYNGLSPESTDITRRVQFLGSAMAKARSLVPEKDDELKVIAWPECFFLGRNGAYTMGALSSLIEQLQDLVKGPEWKHWVFVFGTVNLMYEDADGTLLEMYNHSPVIRGGSEAAGGNASDYTKLIQKVTFSAEMPFTAEFQTPLDNEQFSSDMFRKGFGPTEYEYVFGRIVGELLAVNEPLVTGETLDAVYVAQGAKPGAWAMLKQHVQGEVDARGMTCVVRDLRDPKDTVKWAAPFKRVLMSYAASRATAVHSSVLGVKTKDNFSPEDFSFRCARKPGPWLGATTLPQKRKLTFALEICADHAEARVKNGKTLAHRDILKRENDLRPTKSRLTEQGKSFPKRKRETEEARDEAVKNRKGLQPGTSEMDANDRRLEEIRQQAEALEQEEVVYKEQLAEIIKAQEEAAKERVEIEKQREEFDIQLVPSAGCVLQPQLARVARKDGFMFNCDGWHAPGAMKVGLDKRQGRVLEYKLVGPETPGHNPLLPHSELVKAPDTAVTPPQIVDLQGVADADGIFGEGPGELHIYPVQDLPD